MLALRNGFLGVLFLYAGLVAFAVFLIVSVTDWFITNPTFTSLQSTDYPVNKIPFPGISICNINKISKVRAKNLAKFIASKSNLTEDTVLGWIKFLGNLYDSTYDANMKDEQQQFVRVLATLNLTITYLLKTLTTPCEELLQKCMWNGKEEDCLQLFEFRLTYDGYCCTFNFVKNTTEWWSVKKLEGQEKPLILRNGQSGLENGLSAVLNNDPDDYFYPVFESTGFMVHVFIGTDFPDKASGDLIENVVDLGSENFIELHPTTVISVRDVMSYAVEKRGCLFEVEQHTQFGVYSQSDCFLDCRAKSMQIMCECVPFTIPVEDERSVCTLADLDCLSRYKNKWSYLVPLTKFEDNSEKIREHEDALLCEKTCYPACESTLYRASTTTIPLIDAENVNQTKVHVFYSSRFHRFYKQDVVYYWYEMLSNYGGLVALVLGLSILSLLEVIMYLSKWMLGK